jgi:hypothetical protein
MKFALANIGPTNAANKAEAGTIIHALHRAIVSRSVTEAGIAQC